MRPARIIAEPIGIRRSSVRASLRGEPQQFVQIGNISIQDNFALKGTEAIGSSNSRSLEEAQPWKELASLPENKKQGEVSAGVLHAGGKDYLLVVGQLPGNKGDTLIYDFAEDTWTLGAPRQDIGNHHAAEVLDNTLYLLGGLKEGFHSVQKAQLVVTATGVDVQWTTGADVPIHSGSASTGIIDGLIIYCGGINEEGTETVAECHAYDPVADEWAPPDTIPPMPHGRNHAAACSDGERLFVFGGRVGGNSVGESFANTQIYSHEHGWYHGAPMAVPSGGTGKAVFYKGECYVFGGEVGPMVEPSLELKINAERTLYRVDVYNVASDTWRTAPDMPLGLHGSFPVIHKGVVYVASGGTSAGYSMSTVHYSLDLTLGP